MAQQLSEVSSDSLYGRVLSQLGELGIFAPEDLAGRLRSFNHRIDDQWFQSVDVGADSLVKAWFAAKDIRLRDKWVWTVFLLMVDVGMTNAGPELDRQLSEHRMNRQRTLLEIRLQLASWLYDLGGDLLSDSSSRLAGQALLRLSLEVSDKVLPQVRLLRQTPRRILYGKRGVAKLWLTRADPNPEVLRDAIADMVLAENEGDKSEQHFILLIEAYLRLARSQDDMESVHASVRAWRRATDQKSPTPQLQEALADIKLHEGLCSLKADVLPSAEQAFSKALELYRALSNPSIEREIFTRFHRGQAAYHLFHVRRKRSGRPDSELLDSALGDLQAAVETSSLESSAFPGALLAKAEILKAENKFDAAALHADLGLDYCQANPEVPKATVNGLRLVKAEAHSRLAAEKGEIETGAIQLRTLVELTKVTDVSIASLAHSLRNCSQALTQDELKDAARVVADLADAALKDGAQSNTSRRFAASHAAAALWSVARLRDDPRDVARAYAFYIVAVGDPGKAPLEVLGPAASCAIRLGRWVLGNAGEDSAESALGYFGDAMTWLTTALSRFEHGERSEFFHEQTAASWLGEAFARASSVSWIEAYTEGALRWLKHARALGNQSPEIDSFLGDVYYRRGRRQRATKDLSRAIELKDAAHLANLRSRENRSVAAASCLRLFFLTEDSDWIARAITRLVEAIEMDPKWPWPVVQLAEAATLPPASRQAALDELHDTDRIHPSVTTWAAGDSKKLWDRAAHLAVHSHEFKSHVLGGRQGAYVLQDPHRLLSTTLVIKPCDLSAAEREQRSAGAIRQQIERYGAKDRFEVPEPISLIPDAENRCMYVMRRASGRQLGAHVIDALASDGPRPLFLYERAIEFLALFHRVHPHSGGRPSWLRTARHSLVSSGLNEHAIRAILDKYSNLRLDELPLFPKKDAHAENWLAADGRIVMVDLESTASRPAFFELAQLLEDYPLLPCDQEGWNLRLSYAWGYWGYLNQYGNRLSELDRSSVNTAYNAFAIWHAALGLIRTSRQTQSRRAESSRSREARSLRRQHYVDVLTFLSGTSPSVTSPVAVTMIAELRRRRLFS